MKRKIISEVAKERQREYARQYAEKNKERIKARKLKKKSFKIEIQTSNHIPEFKYHSASGLISFDGSQIIRVKAEEVLNMLDKNPNTVYFDGDTFSAERSKRKVTNSDIGEYWIQYLPRTSVLIIVP